MTEYTKRTSTVERITGETAIKVALSIDGTARIEIDTGIGFLDHLLKTLAFYAGWDIEIKADGDTKVDDHHTVEDCALVIGEALNKALGDRKDIARFGYACIPHDEALAKAVVDLSTRTYTRINLELKRDSLGELACENITHFLETLAQTTRFVVHLDVLHGANDHHKAEAAFKALAQALRQATSRIINGSVNSTKGII